MQITALPQGEALVGIFPAGSIQLGMSNASFHDLGPDAERVLLKGNDAVHFTRAFGGRLVSFNKFYKSLGKSGSEKKPAALKKAFFTLGSEAKDGNDYLIYNKKTGKLYYDAEGSGQGQQVQIATLSKNLKLTNKDFFVI
jgi:hypothetical protein